MVRSIWETLAKSCLYCRASQNLYYAYVHGGGSVSITFPKWSICSALQGLECTETPSAGMLLIFLTQNTLLCPNPFSNHISTILRTKWCCSHWPHDLGSQMPKATSQKWLLRFKMTNHREADESTGIWLTTLTITYTGIQFSPTQVFVYLKKCLLSGLEIR